MIYLGNYITNKGKRGKALDQKNCLGMFVVMNDFPGNDRNSMSSEAITLRDSSNSDSNLNHK